VLVTAYSICHVHVAVTQQTSMADDLALCRTYKTVQCLQQDLCQVQGFQEDWCSVLDVFLGYVRCSWHFQLLDLPNLDP